MMGQRHNPSQHIRHTSIGVGDDGRRQSRTVIAEGQAGEAAGVAKAAAGIPPAKGRWQPRADDKTPAQGHRRLQAAVPAQNLARRVAPDRIFRK